MRRGGGRTEPLFLCHKFQASKGCFAVKAVLSE